MPFPPVGLVTENWEAFASGPLFWNWRPQKTTLPVVGFREQMVQAARGILRWRHRSSYSTTAYQCSALWDAWGPVLCTTSELENLRKWNHAKNIHASPTDTDNGVGMVEGAGAGWRWAKWGEMGTALIVSTIKIKSKNLNQQNDCQGVCTLPLFFWEKKVIFWSFWS